MPIRLGHDNSHGQNNAVQKFLKNLRKAKGPSDLKRVLMKRVRLTGLPIRVRPAFILITVVTLLLLAVLGFHPTLGQKISPPVPWWDKLLHFFAFTAATASFYLIWSIDEDERVWYWRYFPEISCGFVCFIVGGIFSEFVQSWLPYKSFQWGDIVANLFGCSLGLYLSRSHAIRTRNQQEIDRLYQPLEVRYRDLESDSSLSSHGESDIEDGQNTHAAEEGRAALVAPTTKSVVNSPRPGSSMGSGKHGFTEEDNVWDDNLELSGTKNKRHEHVFSLGDDEDEDVDIHSKK